MMNHLLRWTTALASLAFSAATLAQDYPQKQITIVVPFTPGGAVDAVARTMADQLSKAWKQTVIVDNRPGGGGAIGVQAVARAAPDGYTLLLGSVGPMTINPSLQPNLPYNVAHDFTPVILLAKTPAILVVTPQVPVTSVKEFVAWLKSKPGKLNYGSAGTGNITHLVSEYFMSQAGVTANHIPYRGSAPAITDLLGGQIDFMFDVVPTAQPYVKSGKYRGLAVTTLTRSPALPDVPTLNELGYKGFDVSSWFGLFAPAGTPQSVIDKINAEANRELTSGPAVEKLRFLGADPAGGTQAQFKSMIAAETARWKKVIGDAAIKVE